MNRLSPGIGHDNDPTLAEGMSLNGVAKFWADLGKKLYIDSEPDGGVAPRKVFNPTSVEEIFQSAATAFLELQKRGEAIQNEKVFAEIGLSGTIREIVKHKSSFSEESWAKVAKLFSESDNEYFRTSWEEQIKITHPTQKYQ